MRHVKYDPKKLKYPKNWKADADAAFAAVAASDAKDRSALVNKNRKIWASLKPELSNVFHGKCWYTEAHQKSAGTDSDVDHFRPKNAVKGVSRGEPKEDHPGYWWLAFDPANYRYSCIIANRPRRDIDTRLVGGKVDEFPITDEALRCWCADDDLDEEQALIIDPCKASEVGLISFADNGEAISRHSEETMPRLHRKAENSIVLYHLNHSDFVKTRLEIRDRLTKHIEDAKRYYRKLDKGDAANDYAYERSIQEILDMISVEAPFSSFARTVLEVHWAENALSGLISD